MSTFKTLIYNKFNSWHERLTKYRHKVFLSIFEERGDKILGLGCGDGKLTYNAGVRVGANNIIGVDLKDNLAQEYKNKIKLINCNLNNCISIRSETIDIVSGDQIIEHLYDTDLFVNEIYRILKPGGYAVICTENLASLHNLFALLLGKQAFSQFISSKYKLGNSLTPHYKKPVKEGYFHVQVFTIDGLKDIFEFYNFEVEKLVGIIYFPFLPFWAGKIFEKICPAHAQFIAIRVRKRAGHE